MLILAGEPVCVVQKGKYKREGENNWKMIIGKWVSGSKLQASTSSQTTRYRIHGSAKIEFVIGIRYIRNLWSQY